MQTPASLYKEDSATLPFSPPVAGSGDRRGLPLAAAVAMLAGLPCTSATAEILPQDDVPYRILKRAPSESGGLSITRFGSSDVVSDLYPWADVADPYVKLFRVDQPMVGRPYLGLYSAGDFERSPWATLLSDISRWGLLAPNWDGETALAPSAATVSAARQFALAIEDAGLPTPEHFIAPDGEISFDWTDHGRSASVSFMADGSVVAYLKLSSDEPLLPFEGSAGDLLSNPEFLAGLSSFA